MRRRSRHTWPRRTGRTSMPHSARSSRRTARCSRSCARSPESLARTPDAARPLAQRMEQRTGSGTVGRTPRSSMKPGPRRSISQADIVDSAFQILEQKGFAAVSVRGVAAALGLTPTAMYTYFPSKNALLRAMVEQVLSTLDLDAASDSAVPWRDRVHALAAELRARLAEHTGAIVLVTSGPLDGPHARALTESLIAGFTSERMPLADAARAAHAVRAQVLGAAALDAAERA